MAENTDLDVLKGLDFETPPLECETKWCADKNSPAYYHVKLKKHIECVAGQKAKAGQGRVICKECQETVERASNRVCACGEHILPREDYWEVLGKL